MARKNRNAGAAPLTSPQTREERYLANIAGLVATKPAYPFTRTERYLDAISSGTSGLADRVTALETGKLNVIGRGVNLLDNAYFIGGGTAGEFPVNQAGLTSYSDAGITIDRWKLSASPVETLSVQSGCVRLTRTSTGQNPQWVQKVEGIAPGTYTFSLLYRTNVSDTSKAHYYAAFSTGGDARIIPNANGQSWNLFSISVSMTTDRYDVGIQDLSAYLSSANVGDYIEILAAKFELGSLQTLASQVNDSWVLNDPSPNYQQELAKCQRYFQVFRTQALRPTYGIDFRPPLAAEEPTLSSFTLDGVTYYTASAE